MEQTEYTDNLLSRSRTDRRTGTARHVANSNKTAA